VVRPARAGAEGRGWPLDRYFRGVEAAFLRSAWETATRVRGLQGGRQQANHSHLDLGSFVLDALGTRWALDLGATTTTSPATSVGSAGPITACAPRATNPDHRRGEPGPRSEGAHRRLRLLASQGIRRRRPLARQQGHGRWWRGIALLDRREVLIQDEVELKAPADVVWTMHTAATVQVEGAAATLKVGESCLRATILEPNEAKFETASATPPKPQAQNEGVSRLLIGCPP